MNLTDLQRETSEEYGEFLPVVPPTFYGIGILVLPIALQSRPQAALAASWVGRCVNLLHINGNGRFFVLSATIPASFLI